SSRTPPTSPDGKAPPFGWCWWTHWRRRPNQATIYHCGSRGPHWSYRFPENAGSQHTLPDGPPVNRPRKASPETGDDNDGDNTVGTRIFSGDTADTELLHAVSSGSITSRPEPSLPFYPGRYPWAANGSSKSVEVSFGQVRGNSHAGRHHRGAGAGNCVLRSRRCRIQDRPHGRARRRSPLHPHPLHRARAPYRWT